MTRVMYSGRIGLFLLVLSINASFAKDPAPTLLHSKELYAIEIRQCAKRHSGLESDDACLVALHRIHQGKPEDVPPIESTMAGLKPIWEKRFECIDDIQTSPDSSVVAIGGAQLEKGSTVDGVLLINTSRPEAPIFYETDGPPGQLGYYSHDETETLLSLVRMGYSRKSDEVVSYAVSLDSLEERRFPMGMFERVFRDSYTVKISEGTVVPVTTGVARPYRVPANIFREQMFGWKLYENKDYAYLLRVRDALGAAQERSVFCYDKASENWRTFELNGDRTIGKMLGREVVFRVGWDYPESGEFGPCWTGEWLWVRPEISEVVSLFPEPGRLSVDTDILFVANDYVICRADCALRRIELIEGKYWKSVKTILKAEAAQHFYCVFLKE